MLLTPSTDLYLTFVLENVTFPYFLSYFGCIFQLYGRRSVRVILFQVFAKMFCLRGTSRRILPHPKLVPCSFTLQSIMVTGVKSETHFGSGFVS